jgi:serine/threonine protein kinase
MNSFQFHSRIVHIIQLSPSMISTIPVPDFSVFDLPVPFHTQAKVIDSVSLPDVAEVVSFFGFSLLQATPLRCTSNSSVYSAIDRDGQVCALKVSPFHARLVAELSNRISLGDCRFLVASFDNFQTDRYMILQMEFCSGGDLFEQQLSERECWQVLADIAQGLAHMHEYGVLHLDVSPSNIFRCESGFKLGDFGTVRPFGEFRPGDEGAGAYAAPEVFSVFGAVGEAADIFALGVCLLEAASGHYAPRGGEPWYMALRRGEIKLGSDEYPCTISSELREVVDAMLRPDPDTRPSAMLIAGTARWALDCLVS